MGNILCPLILRSISSHLPPSHPIPISYEYIMINNCLVHLLRVGLLVLSLVVRITPIRGYSGRATVLFSPFPVCSLINVSLPLLSRYKGKEVMSNDFSHMDPSWHVLFLK